MGFEKNWYTSRSATTRAERNAVTVDALVEAAAKLQAVAVEVGGSHDYLAKQVRELRECVNILAGDSDHPAELYREQLRKSFEKASEDIDFYGLSKSALENITKGANESVRASKKASESMEKAWDNALINKHVNLMARAFIGASIILALCGVAFTGVFMWKLEPVFTGKAVVSYTQEYESELDRISLELAKTRNELEAYKSQYPNGIGETAQTDLDNANRAAQEAYDAEHGG